MTNPEIQVGSIVTVAGSRFFNGKPQVAKVINRHGDLVTLSFGGAIDWGGGWHVGHLTVGE